MTTIEGLFAQLESYGVDYDRFHGAFSQRDNWGKMVHAFEYVTVLGVVETAWREFIEENA